MAAHLNEDISMDCLISKEVEENSFKGPNFVDFIVILGLLPPSLLYVNDIIIVPFSCFLIIFFVAPILILLIHCFSFLSILLFFLLPLLILFVE